MVFLDNLASMDSCQYDARKQDTSWTLNARHIATSNALIDITKVRSEEVSTDSKVLVMICVTASGP